MTFVPTETGHWVSEQFARLSEILQDYDPYLELRWIPPEKRTDPGDNARPYCIVDTRSNYIVRYVSELDDPVSVLANIFASDNRHGNVLERLDAHNAAVKAFELKQVMEEQEAAKDLALFALKNEKNYWKHDGVKYDSEMRRLE